MSPILPIETLSYYLSKPGFPKFRNWFKSISLLEPIFSDLEDLTYLVETSTWFEDKLRKESINKIKGLLFSHIKKTLNKEPEKYFEEWIESIQKYCYQGYGHRIQYSGYFPQYWCVRCEYYENVKNIPKDVILCGIFCDKYVNLAEIEENMFV